MYTVDQQDRVIETNDFPEIDPRAPLSFIWVDEFRLALAYLKLVSNPI